MQTARARCTERLLLFLFLLFLFAVFSAWGSTGRAKHALPDTSQIASHSPCFASSLWGGFWMLPRNSSWNHFHSWCHHTVEQRRKEQRPAVLPAFFTRSASLLKAGTACEPSGLKRALSNQLVRILCLVCPQWLSESTLAASERCQHPRLQQKDCNRTR